MAQGGIGNQSPATLFQARLDTSIPISNGLKLLPYIGDKVVVSGMTVVVPGTGLLVLNTDNLINAAGADSGAPPVASTLYYVYVSNQKALFSPSSIRLSAQPPTMVNAVKYLGNVGNALNWRFVGWAQLNATLDFESSETNAWIANYYNRLLKTVLANPGYVDDDAFTKYTIPGNWAPVNGGVGCDIGVISNGEDVIDASSVVTGDTTGEAVFCGVGIDGAGPDRTSECYENVTQGISTNNPVFLSEGAHILSLWGASAPSPGNFVADFPRFGLPADPMGSMVIANVFV